MNFIFSSIFLSYLFNQDEGPQDDNEGPQDDNEGPQDDNEGPQDNNEGPQDDNHPLIQDVYVAVSRTHQRPSGP